MCETCGVKNGSMGYRLPDGGFLTAEEFLEYLPSGYFGDGLERMITIVLTVAHLNHDPTDNRRENLMALCQRCHNRHNAPHRALNRQRTLSRKRGQPSLL